MPKIQLKPFSPDYADPVKETGHQACDMPGCLAHAEFRAPKDRALSEHYRFCFTHVQEYNKAWDFFSGMSERDIEEHVLKSMHGDRPTWRYGVNGDAEDILYDKIWQSYNFTDEPPPRQNGFKAEEERSEPEIEAMAIMGIAPPLTLPGLKARYKELVKIHHPDRNGGDKKSEELLKSINMAYTILKLAYEKYEELPERS